MRKEKSMLEKLSALINETCRRGGVFVFIEDGAPAELPLWMAPLQQDQVRWHIPSVLRSAEALRNGKVRTNCEDLIFIFSEQTTLLPTLNERLQGQRLLLPAASAGHRGGTEAAADKGIYDFELDEIDLKSWTQCWERVASGLQGTSEFFSQEDFEGSFEAPCLFLDRDDVLIKNVPYNKDPALVQLMPGVTDLIRACHANGYWVAMVTNQSGLGRGRIRWPEYQAVHQRLLALLAAEACWLDESVWAAYIEDSEIAEGAALAGLRKPRHGMFQQVQQKFRVHMGRSLMIGDSASDLIAAKAAGVRKLYLFASDRTEKERRKCLQSGILFKEVSNFADVLSEV